MPSLLITNCSKEAGGLYCFDLARRTLERCSEEPVRGITRGEDAYYFVGNTGAVYRFDPESRAVRKLAQFPLTGCHDLRWHDGSYYLVATYGNQVLRLNEKFEIQDRLQVIPSNEDVCHANCLAWVEGRMLLSIFTLSGGRREDKNHDTPWRTHGKILELDWEAKRYDVVYEPLCQPHSLLWRNGTMLCCESHTSRVSLLNLETRNSRQLCKLHGFVRGLAFVEGKAFVGISKYRGPMTLTQRLLTPFQPRCAVVQLDPQSWNREAVFPMPGTDVYEILPLEPFPLGRPFRPERTSGGLAAYSNGHGPGASADLVSR